jgi:hypothetical protein
MMGLWRGVWGTTEFGLAKVGNEKAFNCHQRPEHGVGTGGAAHSPISSGSCPICGERRVGLVYQEEPGLPAMLAPFWPWPGCRAGGDQVLAKRRQETAFLSFTGREF